MEKRSISYIIALRRSTTGIDYRVFDNHRSEGHFFYAGRLLKYSIRGINGRKVFLFCDAKHVTEDEADYLRRVDDEQYTMEMYAVKSPKFGTIALIVSDDILPGRAFNDYKSRCEVEQ